LCAHATKKIHSPLLGRLWKKLLSVDESFFCCARVGRARSSNQAYKNGRFYRRASSYAREALAGRVEPFTAFGTGGGMGEPLATSAEPFTAFGTGGGMGEPLATNAEPFTAFGTGGGMGEPLATNVDSLTAFGTGGGMGEPLAKSAGFKLVLPSPVALTESATGSTISTVRASKARA
jgi:hypothetical protein